MKLQQFNQLKIGVVIIVAAIVAESVVARNTLIAVLAMVAGALVLLQARSKVKEVIADERDKEINGKAALLAIRLFGWIAAIASLMFITQRNHNPSFMLIAGGLSYGALVLLILYAVISRYYAQITDIKCCRLRWILIVTIVILVILAIGSIRLFSKEDDWMCQNGIWIEHGHPSFPAPTTPCR